VVVFGANAWLRDLAFGTWHGEWCGHSCSIGEQSHGIAQFTLADIDVYDAEEVLAATARTDGQVRRCHSGQWQMMKLISLSKFNP
jgi:hypothetical protein